MSDEDDIKFRDQCAREIMHSLLSRKDSDSTVNGLLENIDNPKNKDYVDYCLKRMDLYARVSYKIADIMRKARLATFK